MSFVLLVSPDRAKPKPPTILGTIATSPTSISITLGASPNDGAGIASYVYERSSDNGVTWQEVANIPGLNVVDGLRTPSTSYKYRALAIDNSSKRSDYSEIVGTITPAPQALEAPTPVTAVASGYYQINISWGAVAGAVSYEVQVSPDNVTFSPLSTGNTLSTSSTGLLENTTQYVRVRALDAGNNPGTWSTSASATTQKDVTAPTVPGTPTAVVQPTGGVLVTWAASTDVGSTLNKYFIRHYRGGTLLETQSQDALLITSNPDGSSSIEDNNSWLNSTGLVGDTYQVRATDNASVTNNVSNYSNSGTATSSVPSGNLIVLVDFADGTTGGRNTTGNISIVNTPIRRNGGGTATGSGYSMRSYIDKNNNTYGTSGLKRAEIAQLYEAPPAFVPIWYGWSIYIPSSFIVPDNIGPNGRRLTTWEIITQFHPSGAFTFGNPTCHVDSYPNNVYSNATTVQSTQPPLWFGIIGDDRPPATLTTSYQTSTRVQLGLVQIGRWHDFVMRVVWDWRKTSDGGIGHVELWHNGTKYVDFLGQNCFNEAAAGAGNIGPYMKVGMYKGWDIAANVVSDSVYVNVGTRLFYHGELAIALESSGASFATVDPVTRVGPRP